MDECNPITNPFYYAQDVDGYVTKMLNDEKEMKEKTLQQKQIKVTKKRKLPESETSTLNNTPRIEPRVYTSHVIKKYKKAKKIIKIVVENLDSGESSEDEISVQYVVTGHYDDILEQTECLVGKIFKKITEI